MASAPPSIVRPTIAVDLRALVPQATGIGVYTRSLVAALARRGDFRLVGVAHREVQEAGEIIAAGVEIEIQPAPLGVIWQQWQLPRRLARGDFDLFWSPLGILPLRSAVPMVVTVHDLTVLLMPEMHSLKVRLSQLPFLRPTLEQAAAVVAISQATADDVAFHFPQCAPRLAVVHNGVDEDFQPADPAAIAATRHELGCPDGYWLYAGTIEPRKNLGRLLDAWEAVHDDDPAGTPPLLLAGPYGWGSRELMARVETLAPHGMRALGRLPRPRLVAAMQAATGFVYPSLYEGFGLPPAEAMACGVPVVVAETSSLPEVVGDAGLLVAATEPKAIGEAMRRIQREPELAARLAAAGRERSHRFRWERTAEGMARVFHQVLAGQGASRATPGDSAP